MSLLSLCPAVRCTNYDIRKDDQLSDALANVLVNSLGTSRKRSCACSGQVTEHLICIIVSSEMELKSIVVLDEEFFFFSEGIL